MRVLLASPESKVWNSRQHIHMGLGYLAGALRAAGYPVEIYDAAVEKEPLADVLRRGRYDVVGISSPTPLIKEAWEAARVAKSTGAVTILGGPHLTLQPEESMQRPEVDLVVRGEGEDTIVEIMQALELDAGVQASSTAPRLFEHKAWSEILGLSYRRVNGNGGAIVHNPPRPLRPDLDNIPFPAHDLFKIEQYTNLQPLTDGLIPGSRSYTIVTSRGCPFKCTFCSKPITGDTWRMRSVDNVIAEWRWLVRDLKATEIGITDDIWNRDLKRAKELCRRLIAEGLNTVPWVTVHGMKVNYTDLELFQLMKAAGAKRVGFGVESGDQEILNKIIRKGQTLDMVRQAFRDAKAAGLQTMGFFIFGMPHETEETMEKTIRFALELEPDLAHFMIAAPYPGTRLWEMLHEEGAEIFSHDWGDLAIQDDKAHFQMGELTAELVERKWHEAYRRFYLRPRRLARRLFQWDTWRRAPERIRDAKRFFLYNRRRHASLASPHPPEWQGKAARRLG
ncbi:MAG: radical SAM protein [Anaerolineae bacterium]|nr:B12-binding domain-containing radical SAM protein [Anaerolineae bacterium]MDW8098402.1 radical SAM protein [Anaerolineae bacterium]